jgi:hypothetical protein
MCCVVDCWGYAVVGALIADEQTNKTFFLFFCIQKQVT